jgi:hypothetical protein
VYAAEQFMRLGQDTIEPFSGFGVSVVAINVGDEEPHVKTFADWAKYNGPCLLDGGGTAFESVATSKLPRTYLLDAEGKILWFDIEFSLSTARELHNALFYFLRRNDGSTEGVSVTVPSPPVHVSGNRG